ncbi:CRISPR-associated protein Cas5 [Streptomyces sp. NPDC049590]|uniref:CRISPR-associated protein Cas5 n=1 Tax=Streptomyces sp. NPDC049590 TaxID=3154834 RepID=UPI00343813A3
MVRSQPSAADRHLLRILERNGLKLSPYQLERWRTAGLIPRLGPHTLMRIGDSKIHTPATAVLVTGLATCAPLCRTHEDLALLAFLLATRMLVKMDEQQLGWMAADRARQLAEAASDILALAECARQMAVLARKAGWHDQALTIALCAADQPQLRAIGHAGTAVRGLLVQSAAYTLARRGDRDGMRELTDEAAAIANELGGATLLRDHSGGFSPLTVQLHKISAENHAGDPRAALDAARTISLEALPSIERRSRALGDIAVAYDRLGRRSDCVRTLLAAERCAPQETDSRPATKALISSLLVSGPTSTELRGLAERSGVLV